MLKSFIISVVSAVLWSFYIRQCYFFFDHRDNEIVIFGRQICNSWSCRLGSHFLDKKTFYFSTTSSINFIICKKNRCPKKTSMRVNFVQIMTTIIGWNSDLLRMGFTQYFNNKGSTCAYRYRTEQKKTNNKSNNFVLKKLVVSSPNTNGLIRCPWCWFFLICSISVSSSICNRNFFFLQKFW